MKKLLTRTLLPAVTVRRSQGNAGQRWNEAAIVELAQPLNDTIYRHPQTSGLLSLAR